MRAIGIPLEMFTVIFAIGRMPGWIANYKEVPEQAMIDWNKYLEAKQAGE